MTSHLLTVTDLAKRFSRGSGTVPALEGVSLSIERGETLALVGPSGSGKSTLGCAVLRLLQPDAGNISFEGQDLLRLRGRELRMARRRLQMVFQDPHAAVNPR